MMNRKLLIIGPLPDVKNGKGYGGATVLMQNFVSFLQEKHLPFRFVQTNRFMCTETDKPRSLANILYFFAAFFMYIWSARIVMFNFSDHATVKLFPHLARLCHLLGKKIVFRKFGGTLELYLKQLPQSLCQQTFNAIASADLILLETHGEIKYVGANIRHDNIVWFPNVRSRTELRVSPDYCKRFIFISHINTEKGIRELLEVAKNLPDDYVLDIYGPVKEDVYHALLSKEKHYHGSLTSCEVLQRLSKYNVLLLPSYREGYPGIIIEAMSIGMPTIASNVGGIPEIVEDGVNGLLISPKSVEELRSAILSINQENYSHMGIAASERFKKDFEDEPINSEVYNKMLSL